MAKHTQGPWRWEINKKHRSIRLCGGVPKYDLTVMDFKRWGMNGAMPMVREMSQELMNCMEGCDKYAKPVLGREHHSSWFQDVDHSDMHLIASAPELIEALELMVECFGSFEDVAGTDEYTLSAISKARKIISKIRGAV